MGGIIPEYAAVIFDEAHDIEDVAGQYFGVSVSSYQFDELTRDVAAMTHRKEFEAPELDRILISASDRAAAFLSLFGATEGRTGFRSHEAFLIKTRGPVSRRARRTGVDRSPTRIAESAARRVDPIGSSRT